MIQNHLSTPDLCREAVHKAVARHMGIPVQYVAERIILGKSFSDIQREIVFTTGVALSADSQTSVGDLIEQILKCAGKQ